MPRMGRVILPRYPHHIVQRGHNRQVVFVEAEDYRRYLSTLREFKYEYGVQVYAFCLIAHGRRAGKLPMVELPPSVRRGRVRLVRLRSMLSCLGGE